MIWKNTGVFYKVIKYIGIYDYDNSKTFYEGEIYRAKKYKNEMVIVDMVNPDEPIQNFEKKTFDKHFKLVEDKIFNKTMPIKLITERTDILEISVALFGIIGIFSLLGFSLSGYYMDNAFFGGVHFFMLLLGVFFIIVESMYFRRMYMFKKKMKTYFVSYTYDDTFFTKTICAFYALLTTIISIGFVTSIIELTRLIVEYIFYILMSIGIGALIAGIVWLYTYVNYLLTK